MWDFLKSLVGALFHGIIGQHSGTSFSGYLMGTLLGPVLGYFWYHPKTFGETWAHATFPHGKMPKLSDLDLRHRYFKSAGLDALAGFLLYLLPLKNHYLLVSFVAAAIHMIGSLQNSMFKDRPMYAVLIESGYWGLNMLMKGFFLAHPPY